MKRISLFVFATFLSLSVSAFAQQPASDGHLQRAGEKTVDQQNAEKAKATQAPPEKAAPAPPARVEQAPKVAAKAIAPVASAKRAATPVTANKVPEPKLIDGIPEGAQQIEPYAWAYTDTEGKDWIYRRTPFGVSRTPRIPAPTSAASGGLAGVGTANAPEIKVTEAGDDLQFEQPSPFGPRKWTKKKTELTSDEQAAWDRLKKKD